MNPGSFPFDQFRRATTVVVVAALLLGQSCWSIALAAPAAPASPTSKPAAPLKPLTPKVAPAMPPVAPPIKKAEPSTAAQPSIQVQNQVAELEKLMFGEAKPSIPLEYRLDRLESETFHSTNPEWEVSRRVERLTQTLIGNGTQAPMPTTADAPYPPTATPQLPYNQQTDSYPTPDYTQQQQPQQAAAPKRTVASPPPPDLDAAEFQRELPRVEAEKYALNVVNEIRNYNGLPELVWDEVAHKVAQQHVSDLASRNTVSHHSSSGDNPDVRYTKAGGHDALLESLVSLKANGRVPLNKAIVYKIVHELTNSQDDRDALLSQHATRFAFSFANNSPRNDKLIACTEIVTDQADLEPIPSEVRVGEKIDIKGTIKGPYKFQKITLAWEGMNNMPNSEEEQDEALPYFPPLDYTAYAKRAERDWDKAVRMLQLGGMGLAIAGGMFIPPVALAAPLIAAAAPAGRPKAMSDIPVKGGVKVSGSSFEHRTTISKDDKEGIYYITVWVQADGETAPIAISRRAVVARLAESTPISQNGNDNKERELLTVIGKDKDDADSKGAEHKAENESK